MFDFDLIFLTLIGIVLTIRAEIVFTVIFASILQITNYNVASSKPAYGEVYSIQHYVIKFVSDLRKVGGFLRGTPFSSVNKTDCHDITEILLKVVLSTIALTLQHINSLLNILPEDG
jgi:hypothetical protein